MNTWEHSSLHTNTNTQQQHDDLLGLSPFELSTLTEFPTIA